MALLSVAALASTLTINVYDGAGNPAPARLYVVSSDDSLRYARPLETGFGHVSANEANFKSHFYTLTGTADVTLPDGATVVGAAKGFEYTTFFDTVAVSGATTVNCTLTHWLDMEALGWYSGDNHGHIYHPPLDYDMNTYEARKLAEAEDINVLACVDNAYLFTGTQDTASTAANIVYMGLEIRSAHWGHQTAHGTSSYGLTDSVFYHTSLDPCAADIADSVHADTGSAWIVAAHPRSRKSLAVLSGNHRARELPVDVSLGKLDAYDVLSISNTPWGITCRELDIYYHLLNCGFQLPASAGTDAVANKTSGGAPLGGLKVYAFLDDSDLTYNRFYTNMAAGKTFVTNGPLFTSFTAKGHSAGDSVNIGRYSTYTVPVAFAAQCESDMARAEIVANGAVLDNVIIGATSIDTSVNVTISEPSWLAVRIWGAKDKWHTVADSLFAQTSPVYLSMNGQMPVESASAAHLEAWCDSLTTIAQAEAKSGRYFWSSPAESTRVHGLIQTASDLYAGLFAAKNVFTVGTGGDYTTIANALAGEAANNDTIMLLAGTHAAGMGLSLPHNMTIRGATSDPSLYVVKNSGTTGDVFACDSTAIFRDLTFRGIGNGPLESWFDSTATGNTQFYNCEFQDLHTAYREVFLFDADGNRAQFEDCVFDSCRALNTNAARTMLAAWNMESFVFRNCVMTNCTSGLDNVIELSCSATHDTILIARSLFVDNTGADNGFLKIFGNGDASRQRVVHCTFDNSECTDGADGVIYFTNDVQNIDVIRSIFTGAAGTDLFATGASSGADSIAHCNAYGNADNIFGLGLDTGGVGTDTLKIDPNYNKEEAIAGGYIARAKACRIDAGGGYMGWELWELSDDNPLGSTRSPVSRRRRH
ncbi:MAG: CehA/McbA family metallohydrolase [Verrucomicrobiota bacterium]